MLADTAAGVVEIVMRDERRVLCLRGSLDISDATVLRNVAVRFAAEVGESGAKAACVDLSAMESGDVAILQVLAALNAEFLRENWQLKVAGPREAVQDQWRKAGWPGFSASH